MPLGIIPGISLGLVIQKAQECLVKIEQASSDQDKACHFQELKIYLLSDEFMLWLNSKPENEKLALVLRRILKKRNEKNFSMEDLEWIEAILKQLE